MRILLVYFLKNSWLYLKIITLELLKYVKSYANIQEHNSYWMFKLTRNFIRAFTTILLRVNAFKFSRHYTVEVRLVVNAGVRCSLLICQFQLCRLPIIAEMLRLNSQWLVAILVLLLLLDYCIHENHKKTHWNNFTMCSHTDDIKSISQVNIMN